MKFIVCSMNVDHGIQRTSWSMNFIVLETFAPLESLLNGTVCGLSEDGARVVSIVRFLLAACVIDYS